MRILGIDPDLHTMGLAFIDTETGFLQAGFTSVPNKLKGDKALVEMAKVIREEARGVCSVDGNYQRPQLVIVEKPEIYRGGKASPKSITDLSIATGIALHCIRPNETTKSVLVEPKKWKGQIPKAVKHKRILEEAGIEYHIDPRGNVIPKDLSSTKTIPSSYWTHCIDAIGLALWGKERAMSGSPNF